MPFPTGTHCFLRNAIRPLEKFPRDTRAGTLPLIVPSLSALVSALSALTFAQAFVGAEAVPFYLPGQTERQIVQVLGEKGRARSGAKCPCLCPWGPFLGDELHSLYFPCSWRSNSSSARSSAVRLSIRRVNSATSAELLQPELLSPSLPPSCATFREASKHHFSQL